MTRITLVNGDFMIVKETPDAILHNLHRAVPVKGVNGPTRLAGFATVTLAEPARLANTKVAVFKHAIAFLQED